MSHVKNKFLIPVYPPSSISTMRLFIKIIFEIDELLDKLVILVFM